MKLFFLRHTSLNVEIDVFYGQTDLDVSDRFEEEVKLRAGEGTVLYATSKIADINPILAKAGFVRSDDAGTTWGELYPIETVGDAFILDHDIISNRKKNLLHMVWSQFADGQLLDQALYVMTISDEEAQ